MIKSNQSSKPLLIFPENSASIITNILKKYGLEESNKELFEKWEKNQKDRGEILVDLLMKILETDFSVSELAALAQKELNIPSRKAQKIIGDLTKEVLTPAIQISEKTLSEGKLKEIPPEAPKTKAKDLYRETIK